MFCAAIATLILILEHSQAIEVGPWEGRTFYGITGTISFPNPNTLLIDNFSYDNRGIVVFLYYYPPGRSVDNNGIIIPIREGRGELNREYSNEPLLVNLPSGTTACDIGILTVWCQPARATFSRVTIPRSTFINNGEGECQLVGGNTDLPTVPPAEFLNCMQFTPTLQLSWTVDNDNSEVDFRICSCRPLEAGVNQYMAFGLSGRTDSTAMVGADATIAWVDNADGSPNAVDYYITARTQCRGGEGVCPDTSVGGQSCTNDIRNTSIVGGIQNENQQCVIFSRPFTTNDSQCDIAMDPTNQMQYIVWAMGGLGETAFIHFSRSDPNTDPIHLGRNPVDQCTSGIMCASCPPFIGKRRVIPDNTTLRVYIGPSAGQRGYMGITGQPGWGISWYVDGVLIPELVVTRGSTYTFIVEGGTDENDLSQYHPFYITDSISGGRVQNSQDLRDSERVFAGFDAQDIATGVGRLCLLNESQQARNIRETCGTFDNYLSEVVSQEPTCASGMSGTVTWTPDETTPNLVYYQCATHLNLGWKITVMPPLENGVTTPLENGVTTPLENGVTTPLENGVTTPLENGVTTSLENGVTTSLENGVISSLQVFPLLTVLLSLLILLILIH